MANYLFQLEPNALIGAIERNPPAGFDFSPVTIAGKKLPAFLAKFDLLLTADQPLRELVLNLTRLLPQRFTEPFLQPQTLFAGTTVSEFALIRPETEIAAVPAALLAAMRELKAKYVILKDIAPTAAILSPMENAVSNRLCEALAAAGFVLLDGQAMAYIPVDFSSLEEFYGRFSASRRSDFRRKQKKRAYTQMRLMRTGDPALQDDKTIDELYRLYENVYNNSAVHFDKLTWSFFAAILRDSAAGGILFTYYRQETLIGYSLCFHTGDILIDKFHGAVYPDYRLNNLYYVNWFDMLQYALDNHCKAVVFGWTNPEIKAYLGASFIFTKHAVYPANPLLRIFLRYFAGTFESDRKILDAWYEKHRKT